jgi:hypothetical protein
MRALRLRFLDAMVGGAAPLGETVQDLGDVNGVMMYSSGGSVAGQTLKRGRAGVAAIPKRLRRPKRAAAGGDLESAAGATGCGSGASSSQPSGLAFSRRPRTAENNGPGERAVAVHVAVRLRAHTSTRQQTASRVLRAECLAQREH